MSDVLAERVRAMETITREQFQAAAEGFCPFHLVPLERDDGFGRCSACSGETGCDVGYRVEGRPAVATMGGRIASVTGTRRGGLDLSDPDKLGLSVRWSEDDG